MPIYARAHQEVVHIWSEDPSLSDESTEAQHEEFKKTGDTAKLTYRPDATPVLWELKTLTRAQKLRLGNAMEAAVAQARAVGGTATLAAQMMLYVPCDALVACGLVGVKGLFDAKGEPVKLERDGDRLSADTMEMLSLNAPIVELGVRIWEISQPDPTRGQA